MIKYFAEATPSFFGTFSYRIQMFILPSFYSKYIQTQSHAHCLKFVSVLFQCIIDSLFFRGNFSTRGVKCFHVPDSLAVTLNSRHPGGWRASSSIHILHRKELVALLHLLSNHLHSFIQLTGRIQLFAAGTLVLMEKWWLNISTSSLQSGGLRKQSNFSLSGLCYSCDITCS